MALTAGEAISPFQALHLLNIRSKLVTSICKDKPCGMLAVKADFESCKEPFEDLK